MRYRAAAGWRRVVRRPGFWVDGPVDGYQASAAVRVGGWGVASPAAGYITGSELHVNGGMAMV